MTLDRSNGFGALRLLLASLVIVSHSFEMLDGDRHREPLSMLYGDMTFGIVAITGFFLISGYLITGSYISAPKPYLWKRTLRLYPGYVVCALLCLFLVAPLAGGPLPQFSPIEFAKLCFHLALLEPATAKGAFSTLAYPDALNGSMWTLAFEFRCYLLVIAFGIVGLYARRWLYLALTIAVLIAAALTPEMPIHGLLYTVLGEPHWGLMLLGAFMVGACFRLFPQRFTWRRAAVCGTLMIALMFIPALANTALVTLGGYVLFWLALNVKWKPLLTINAKDDISYGVYLYAWPIGALLLWYWRDIDPATLMATTLAGALVCGWLSWQLVEKPALALKAASWPFGHRSFLTP